MSDSDSKISVQPGYVLVERAAGYEVTLSEQPEMLAKISAACRAAECRNVMILGSRTTVKLSTQDILELGKKIADLNLQIAVVEQHDVTDKETGLLEAVAYDRLSCLQFFDNEQDAKDWLGVT